VLVYPY